MSSAARLISAKLPAMVVIPRQANAQPVRWFGSRRVQSVFVALGLVLVGYLVSLVLRGGPTNPAADGWFVVVFEAVGTGMCVARAVTRRHQRSLPILLGAALFMWTAGDAVLTLETASGASVPTPSAADALYLCFYPLMYVALVVLLRREVRNTLPGMWLDGAVAGLGVSAVCATFLLGALERSLGGGPAAVAVGLAYPVGDLLLLALAVGGS